MPYYAETAVITASDGVCEAKTLSFFVPGNPKGQPRPRAFARAGHVRVYDPHTAEGWKSQIAAAVQKHWDGTPFTGPTLLDIKFFFARPKSHYRSGKHADELKPDVPRYHTQKPNRNNLDKAVIDALVTLGVLSDDAIVCGGDVSKHWSSAGPSHSGATIIIQELE